MSNMMNALMREAADEKLVEWAKKGDLDAYVELVRRIAGLEKEKMEFMKNLSEIQRAKYLVFSVEFYRALGEKLIRARVGSKDKRES